MKKMIWRILMAVTMVIVLLAGISLAENEPWDCPQCDRKGNTGNFCGGCGHARPEDGAINASNFPDENFRKYVSDHFDTDHDEILSDSERKSVIEIDCSELSISNLKGIEYFTELEVLKCNRNELTALDVSKNILLTNLLCISNQLTSLDISENAQLTRLSCGDNQLTSLDISKNTQLISLGCFENQLTSLDVGKNAQLTSLICYSNQLTSLDVSKNTQLTSLFCYDNQLNNLDVSMNTQLVTLLCDKNQLTNLDVSKNTQLTSLDCSNNQLTILDVSKNTQLTWLECNINRLSELDISECPLLIEVFGKDAYNDQNGKYHSLLTDSSTRVITGK